MPVTIKGWIFWLFSVVIVGILVDLAASYLKPRADRWFEGLFERRLAKNEEKAQRFERSLNLALNDPAAIAVYASRMLLAFILLSAMVILTLLSLMAFRLQEIQEEVAGHSALDLPILYFRDLLDPVRSLLPNQTDQSSQVAQFITMFVFLVCIAILLVIGWSQFQYFSNLTIRYMREKHRALDEETEEQDDPETDDDD